MLIPIVHDFHVQCVGYITSPVLVFFDYIILGYLVLAGPCNVTSLKSEGESAAHVITFKRGPNSKQMIFFVCYTYGYNF